MTQFVIGYGFGRCGTQSLSHLLNIQPDSCFSHELHGLHWLPALGDYPKVRNALYERGLKYEFVGDVNYAWVQYIPQLMTDFPTAKLIHIWRDKEESVESFWGRSQDRVGAIETASLWACESTWYGVYPFFGFPPSKDQIANTYEVFHKIAETILYIYPKRTYSLSVKSLNNLDSVKKLLDFVGVPEDKQVVRRVIANRAGQSPLSFFAVPNEEFAKKYNYSMKVGITI